MATEKRQLELQKFVEEVGLLFEDLVIPRMAGRMLGWLLICDPPHQSMQELTEALRASKASISNTTRLLMQIGLIERISLPDYRYDHYRLKPGAWYELTRQKARQITAVRRLAERGLKLMEGQDPALKDRLEEMCQLYSFFEQEFPTILKRWETIHQIQQEGTT